MDHEVWKQTLEERDHSWIRGPFSEEDMPLGAAISRRLGLRQRHKAWLIDDFSESSVSQAVTVSETPVLHTIDVACALVSKYFSGAAKAELSSELVVRPFDLSSAYRHGRTETTWTCRRSDIWQDWEEVYQSVQRFCWEEEVKKNSE